MTAHLHFVDDISEREHIFVTRGSLVSVNVGEFADPGQG
jgi:hypothetical protein